MLYSNRKIFKVQTPIEAGVVKHFKAGDEVLLSGTIFTARDQAHKRLVELIKKNKPLPLDLKGQIIYYCGPTLTRPGHVIGSCGPTTSSRMDKMTQPLLALGLKGMIGKGRRSPEVRQAVRRYKAVYFLTTGGAGAFLSKRVISSRPIAFEDLGPEAIFELRVKDFPLIVGIDTKGKDIFFD